MRSSFNRFITDLPRVAAIALVAAAGVAPQAQARDVPPAPLRSLEDAIETNTEAVLLPTSQPGTLTFRNCAEPCRLRTLNATAQSKFFVGGSEVTLAEFTAYIRGTGPQFMMVFRQPDGSDITRLVVYGQLPQQR